MKLSGMWKITAMSVVEVDPQDHSISKTWRGSEDIIGDERIHPMQRLFAQGVYKFEEDGTAYSLMPKALVPAGEGEAYNDEYVIAQKTQWKEEDGKLYIAALENGEPDWQEMIPAGEGFEIFGYQRIARA